MAALDSTALDAARNRLQATGSDTGRARAYKLANDLIEQADLVVWLLIDALPPTERRELSLVERSLEVSRDMLSVAGRVESIEVSP
jgi:hypothetical protein